MTILIISLPFYDSAYEEPLVLMSSLPQRDQHYEVIDVDHEYEGLDKYNKSYEFSASPQVPSSVQHRQTPSGDYEFTQCPAYMPSVSQRGYHTDHESFVRMEKERRNEHIKN